MLLRAVVLAPLMLFGACKKGPITSAVPSDQESLLELARQRTAPSALRSRFSFKIQSQLADGSTGGALIVDRPGQGHLAVLGPLGGPLMTLQSDGTGLAVISHRDRSHLLADDAEGALRKATDGLAGVDDVLGLLVGELPLDGLELKATSRTEVGDLQAVFDGPQGTTVEVVIDDPLGTPVLLRVENGQGTTLLTANYEEFERLSDDGPYMPSEASVAMARFDLQLDLRFKRWDVLGDEVPAVFGLEPPDGYTTGSLKVVQLPGQDGATR